MARKSAKSMRGVFAGQDRLGQPRVGPFIGEIVGYHQKRGLFRRILSRAQDIFGKVELRL